MNSNGTLTVKAGYQNGDGILLKLACGDAVFIGTLSMENTRSLQRQIGRCLKSSRASAAFMPIQLSEVWLRTYEPDTNPGAGSAL